MAIRIGREYEEVFNSICKLFANHCISSSVIESVDYDRKIIYTPNNEFVYDSTVQNIETGDSAYITSEGAAWFDLLRNPTVEKNDSAAFITLINTVVNEYQRNYSFVEFMQRAERISEEEKDTHKKLASRFAALFLDNIGLNYSIDEYNNENKDDIYGVSLKIDIDGGTGEAEPILCKIYLKRRKGEMYPLDEAEARNIENNLHSIIPSDIRGFAPLTEEKGETIDIVLNAVDQAIRSGVFHNKAILNSKKDDDILNNIIRKSPRQEVEIKCRNVNILSISHVEWKNTSYIYKNGNRPLLRFEFSINNGMTIYCVNCGNELLVDNNRILMKPEYYETDEEPIEYRIDPSDPYLGFNREIISIIKEQSLLADHLKVVSCRASELLRGNKTCEKVKCINQIITFDTDKGVVSKCKDCPYPEIIVRDENGKLCLTQTLNFIYDKTRLVSEEYSKFTCKCCQRLFSSESNVKDTNLCNICYNAFNVKEGEQKAINATELYKTYSRMFPLVTRIRYSFSKKYCFEDESMIIFKMGNTKYYFDKISQIKFNGLMVSPKKIK